MRGVGMAFLLRKGSESDILIKNSKKIKDPRSDRKDSAS